MGRRGSRALWIVAAVMTILTAAAIVVDPRDFSKPEPVDELTSTIEKAATYYEFEHYDRAAETYAEAAALGMESGQEWFRYARSLEQSSELDLESYLTAYRLLLEQSPGHDFLSRAESILVENAVEFDYDEAVQGAHPEGTLMVATGMIYRVRPGRFDGGVDTLFVDTKTDKWFGYMGNQVRIIAPKRRGYQSGETVRAIGWYDGWCEISDDAGLSTSYPCIIAAGVIPVR